MCVPASMARWTETRVLQSMEVGPFFSSDGAMLLSDLPALERRAAPARREGQEIQWCVSADDPRCAPRDSLPNDGPSSLIEGAHLASTSPLRPRVAPAGLAASRNRDAVRGARPGVRDRVERPPAR